MPNLTPVIGRGNRFADRLALFLAFVIGLILYGHEVAYSGIVFTSKKVGPMCAQSIPECHISEHVQGLVSLDNRIELPSSDLSGPPLENRLPQFISPIPNWEIVIQPTAEKWPIHRQREIIVPPISDTVATFDGCLVAADVSGKSANVDLSARDEVWNLFGVWRKRHASLLPEMKGSDFYSRRVLQSQSVESSGGLSGSQIGSFTSEIESGQERGKSEYSEKRLKPSPPYGVFGRLRHATLFAQIGVIMIFGALTAYMIENGLDGLLFDNRRSRGIICLFLDF
jgi:hypothetical protein